MTKKKSAGKTKKAVRKPAKTAKKKTATKPVAKKKATGKPAARKPAAGKKRPRKPAVRKAVEKVLVRKAPVAKKLTVREKTMFGDRLVNLYNQIAGRISFLAHENLSQNSRDSSGDLSRYSTHMADQGTDSFDRELALSLVSTEQDVLFEIEEARQRLSLGTYGDCELCGAPIERGRLDALPFARMCMTCQSDSERGKARVRPSQGVTLGSSASLPKPTGDDQ